jgi:hypothetical protein
MSRNLGWAALGGAAIALVFVGVVGVQLIVRGYEVDTSGNGFTTPAEAIVLFGGLAVAIAGSVLGLVLTRRRPRER